MSQDKKSTDKPDKQPPHKAETQKIPPTAASSSESEPTADQTRPTAPYNASEAGGPLPELDEGPQSQPVDEIQEAIFEAGQQGTSTEIDFEALPAPTLEDKPAKVSETQRDAGSDDAEEETAGPLTDLDEGPPPTPVDEIQQALFEADRQGVSPEVAFDDLPAPALPPEPRKKISRPVKPSASQETEPHPVESAGGDAISSEPAPDTIPLPDFSDSQPAAIVSDFWLILSLFISFRLLTLFLLRPGGYIRDWSDFDTYLGIASLSDYSLFPFLDFWLEWPPLVPWLAVGAYRLSLLLPPWTDDPRLWFILILGSIFVLFEIGNFLLIHRLTRRLFQAEVMRNRVLWLYAGLFPPIYAMLGFFDSVALFFILLSLELLLEDRRFLSAIMIGVGFLVKIIPVLMLPVALRRLWDQYKENPREAGIELGLYAVVFGLTVIILLAPFLVAGPAWVLASARSMIDRSAWETIWAILEGYYGFGVVLGDRLNPDEINFAVHTVSVPVWVTTVRIIFVLTLAIIYIFILIRPIDYKHPRNLIALSGFTIAAFMLYAKGYSPQFLVYLLPFVIMLMPNVRGITYILMLTGLNVLEQPVYFVLLPDQRWLLIFIVAVRFLLIAILFVEFAIILWPEANWAIRVAPLRGRVPVALGSFSAVALLILTPLMFRAYAANRLNDTPTGTFVGFMESLQQNPTDLQNCEVTPEARRLFFSEQTTYREIYPYLSTTFELQITAGAPEESNYPPPTAFLPDSGLAWILPTGRQGQTLARAASNNGRRLAEFDFEELGVASLYNFSNDNTQPCIPLARFNGNIELLTHDVETASGRVNITLYWRATTTQSQNLTVFTQILNSDGQQVAGHDSVPRNGTAPIPDWPINAIQADWHQIQLPPSLPPGEYQVIAGLYTDPGQRIRAIGPDGFNYANQAVPLGAIRLP